MGNTAVIALGTNLEDKMQNINNAVAALKLVPRTKVTGASYVYQTDPVGYEQQDKFYNACIQIETDLSPQAVLGACLGIEAALGRVREIKDGPRIIDLDLLFYESIRCESRELTLPHPRILERAFVMVPLLDLYPSGRVPSLYFGGKLSDLDTDGVERTLFEIEL